MRNGFDRSGRISSDGTGSNRGSSASAVIMVGVAFGVDSVKQAIGDVLISKRIVSYEPQRIGTQDGKVNAIPRGSAGDASTKLLNHFRAYDLQQDATNIKVRFGLIVSGEKLVDSLEFRAQLLEFEPEAIGGEMEGAGLYAACQNAKVD